MDSEDFRTQNEKTTKAKEENQWKRKGSKEKLTDAHTVSLKRQPSKTDKTSSSEIIVSFQTKPSSMKETVSPAKDCKFSEAECQPSLPKRMKPMRPPLDSRDLRKICRKVD